MNELVDMIIAFLEEAREKYSIPKSELEKNGAIIYANGNDGTDFDWEANGRLCEFGYGTKDGSVWAFKCYVYNDGNADIYCYPHGEMRPVETLKRKLMTANAAEDLYKLMLSMADYREKYDCTLDEIFN